MARPLSTGRSTLLLSPPRPPHPAPPPRPPQLLYLFFALATESPSAVTVGLIVSVATLSKTVLYFLMVHFIGWNNAVPSSVCITSLITYLQKGGAWKQASECPTFFLQFLIPNAVWVVVPFLVVVALGRQLSTANARFKGE